MLYVKLDALITCATTSSSSFTRRAWRARHWRAKIAEDDGLVSARHRGSQPDRITSHSLAGPLAVSTGNAGQKSAQHVLMQYTIPLLNRRHRHRLMVHPAVETTVSRQVWDLQNSYTLAVFQSELENWSMSEPSIATLVALVKLQNMYVQRRNSR